MPNPAQKQINDEELAEVSALFEDYSDPYHRNVVQSTQSGGNCQGLDTSLPATQLALATAAAEAVFNNPGAELEFEPDDVASARAAVNHLENLFASAPGTFITILEGARGGAEMLSGDRLQGLSEIVQNADDAGATEVHFLLLPEALLIAHNGHPVSLRDVHALATPWLTTKRHDSKAIGRFGIGLMTLQALSNTFELHSGPYDVLFAGSTFTTIEPLSVPIGFANADDTFFRIPVLAT